MSTTPTLSSRAHLLTSEEAAQITDHAARSFQVAAASRCTTPSCSATAANFLTVKSELDSFHDILLNKAGDSVAAGTIFPTAGALRAPGPGPPLPDPAPPVLSFEMMGGEPAATAPPLTVPFEFSQAQSFYRRANEFVVFSPGDKDAEAAARPSEKHFFRPQCVARYRYYDVCAEQSASSTKTVTLPPFLDGASLFSHFPEIEENLRRRVLRGRFDNTRHLEVRATRVAVFGEGDFIKVDHQEDFDMTAGTAGSGGGAAVVARVAVNLPALHDLEDFRYTLDSTSVNCFAYGAQSYCQDEDEDDEEDDDDASSDLFGASGLLGGGDGAAAAAAESSSSSSKKSPLDRIRLSQRDLIGDHVPDKRTVGGNFRFFLGGRRMTRRFAHESGVLAPEKLFVEQSIAPQANTCGPRHADKQCVAQFSPQLYTHAEVCDGEPASEATLPQFANILALPIRASAEQRDGHGWTEVGDRPRDRNTARRFLPMHYVAWRAGSGGGVPFDVTPLKQGLRIMVFYDVVAAVEDPRHQDDIATTSRSPPLLPIHKILARPDPALLHKLRSAILPALAAAVQQENAEQLGGANSDQSVGEAYRGTDSYALGYLLRNKYFDEDALLLQQQQQIPKISPEQLVGIDASLFAVTNTLLECVLVPVLVCKMAHKNNVFATGTSERWIFDLSTEKSVAALHKGFFSRDSTNPPTRLDETVNPLTVVEDEGMSVWRSVIIAGELGLGSLLAGYAARAGGPGRGYSSGYFWSVHTMLVCYPARESKWKRRRWAFLIAEHGVENNGLRRLFQSCYPAFYNVCFYL